ncbi:MAG: response regulator [Hormoscilla sp. GUM202]|nr:response regulator [Hormoscilla sp. GUM202]
MRVRDMLREGNFEVLEAKDGEEGLKFIRQERPNLIVLDFLLPKVSGWDVFQNIRGHAQWRKIPLVLMSGRKEEVTEKILEPFEFWEFIEKPFEQKQLISAIKSAMKKATKVQPPLEQEASAPAATTALSEAAAPATAGAGSAEIEQLKQQMAKMQAEIQALKKQVAQIEPLKQQLVKIFNFVKQKVK